jgi:hypothetical protein
MRKDFLPPWNLLFFRFFFELSSSFAHHDASFTHHNKFFGGDIIAAYRDFDIFPFSSLLLLMTTIELTFIH